MKQFSKALAAALAWCWCGVALAVGLTVPLPSGQALNIVEGFAGTRSGYFLEQRFPDGVRDPQFGTAGRSFFTMGDDNSAPASLRVDATGRILVTGATPTADGRSAAVVLRFLPNGRLDDSWGERGRGVAAATRGEAAGADALALADGSVLVLGTIQEDLVQRAALWRFGSDGQPDSAFAGAGQLVAAGLPDSEALSIQQGADGAVRIALQSMRDDKLWLEVHRWNSGGEAPQRIARQEHPEDWAGPAQLAHRAGAWVWFDASQPQAPPIELVPAAPESLWTSAAAGPGARPAEPATAASGHAALNPFSKEGATGSGPSALTLDDLAWPGLLVGALAMLGGALWRSRREE